MKQYVAQEALVAVVQSAPRFGTLEHARTITHVLRYRNLVPFEILPRAPPALHIASFNEVLGRARALRKPQKAKADATTPQPCINIGKARPEGRVCDSGEVDE